MAPDYRESRKHRRHKILDTFIVNQESICQIFNLSSEGIAFGCTIDSKIPSTLTVDIFNNAGLHIFNIPLEKVWLATNEGQDTPSMYEIILGAKFCGKLSREQQAALDQILEFLWEKTLYPCPLKTIRFHNINSSIITWKTFIFTSSKKGRAKGVALPLLEKKRLIWQSLSNFPVSCQAINNAS